MLSTLQFETRETGARPVAVRPWTTFAFSAEAGAGSRPPLTVELVNAVRGAAPEIASGWCCMRRDGLAARPPRPEALSFGGSPDMRWRAADEHALDQRLASGTGRVVLLLGLGGGAADAERAAALVTTDPALRGRVRQRHYRPRAESGLDLLACFEMLPADVAPLREVLARARRVRGRAHAGAVEWELWMVGASG